MASKEINISTFGAASGGFEGWAYSNTTCMYYLFSLHLGGTESLVLCSYRMYVWDKIATQPSPVPEKPSTTHIVTTGLSSNLRPQYFSSYPTPPSTPGPSPSALSALLPGKHSAIGYGSYSSYNGLPTPPGSPNLALKGTSDRGIERLGGIEKDREHQEQSPALAMLAGQTLFKRLGGAC